MLRRPFLTTLLGLPLSLTLPQAGAAAALPDEDSAPDSAPRFTVSRAQLQAALAQRFPLRYPVPGVFDLELQQPQLELLPKANRLGAELALQASGPALQRSLSGSLALDFGLRYEASDRTLRATRLRLLRLQFPGLPPGVQALLDAYGPALAEQSLQEVVLHRLSPKDLALADNLGLQPGRLTVTDAGVQVELVPKTTPAPSTVPMPPPGPSGTTAV